MDRRPSITQGPQTCGRLVCCTLAGMLLIWLSPAWSTDTTRPPIEPASATPPPATKKPGYRIVDGEVTVRDGRRYINIYLKYDDGRGDDPAVRRHQPAPPLPLTFSKYEYGWALDLLSQGKTREAAALFERCAQVKITCVYTLRDDLKMIPLKNGGNEAYFNGILLRLVEKNIDKKYYAELLRMIDPLHLGDIDKTLMLIHKALRLHGEMEELRALEEQIYVYN